jgi:hypothetical protein
VPTNTPADDGPSPSPRKGWKDPRLLGGAVIALILAAFVLLPPKAIDWIPGKGADPGHEDDLGVGKCLDKGDDLVGCGDRAAAYYKVIREVGSDGDCPPETAVTYEDGPILPLLFKKTVYCTEALKGPDVPLTCRDLEEEKQAERKELTAWVRDARGYQKDVDELEEEVRSNPEDRSKIEPDLHSSRRDVLDAKREVASIQRDLKELEDEGREEGCGR